MWNLMKIGQVVSEKKMFKDYTILYMSTAQGQGQIIPGVTKFWLLLKGYIKIQPKSFLGSGEEDF